MKRAKTSRFVLHERLAGDTILLCDLRLSRVLLMDDARFPWLILVPRKPGLSELFKLPSRERKILVEEVAHCARHLLDVTRLDKINIGALGNLVPQLHIHVVARASGDEAWPGPVWGSGKRRLYTAVRRAALVRQLRSAIGER